jgi:hypothetical protein
MNTELNMKGWPKSLAELDGENWLCFQLTLENLTPKSAVWNLDRFGGPSSFNGYRSDVLKLIQAKADYQERALKLAPREEIKLRSPESIRVELRFERREFCTLLVDGDERAVDRTSFRCLLVLRDIMMQHEEAAALLSPVGRREDGRIERPNMPVTLRGSMSPF